VSEPQKSIRCAIYTRKSTDDGLEQEFNSLHAQREAAEAYIQSQRQSGWNIVAERYDDGGFSGANIERPALRKLLADVEAGGIDCVLVYKVDRLSRSLIDFARLMEHFEKLGVTFVSVTQDFNTTTSLGRLTLNILLSFAQFEREIISERTRDKLGAARRKGKWIGGTPVLGYDVDPKGGRLRMNDVEACRVRSIFQICSEAATLDAALAKVDACGFLTKDWTSRAGRRHPGKPFSKSSLRAIVANPLYTGVVVHKGQPYAGEHTAIISRELWDAAQRTLNAAPVRKRSKRNEKQMALLTGLLRCARCGSAMTPSYTARHGRKYVYYSCAVKAASCGKTRVRAEDIEGPLRRHMECMIGVDTSRPVLERAIEYMSFDGKTNTVLIQLRDGTRSECLLPPVVRPGARQHDSVPANGRVPRISRLMALAIKLERLVREGSVRSFSELAHAGHVSRARMSQLLRLTELSPAIQEEILFLPATLTGNDALTERGLRQVAGSMDWEWQMKLFRSLMKDAPHG
jgi:site-specific DNA recombinase